MDDYYDPRRIHADDDDDNGRRMSRLSIESTDGDGDDADAELSDQDNGPKAVGDESDKDAPASLPGTPERRRACRPIWVKEYASDAEARGLRKRSKGRRGRARERWLERAWEMRKCRETAEGEYRVLVRPRGRDSSMQMDMEEVKACRDLGLELPCDWTVEIPCDTSSGGNSPPVANWMISSPGDDPNDVKARLKAWAQAVVLASASRLGS